MATKRMNSARQFWRLPDPTVHATAPRPRPLPRPRLNCRGRFGMGNDSNDSESGDDGAEDLQILADLDEYTEFEMRQPIA